MGRWVVHWLEKKPGMRRLDNGCSCAGISFESPSSTSSLHRPNDRQTRDRQTMTSLPPSRRRIVLIDEIPKTSSSSTTTPRHDGEMTFVKLPALETGGKLTKESRIYGLQNCILYEVQRSTPQDPAKASWFIENTVLSGTCNGYWTLTNIETYFSLSLSSIFRGSHAPPFV